MKQPLIFVLGALLATIPPALALAEAGSALPQIFSALSGAWTGQLEYRDFQTDKRVFLPTWLDIAASPDGKSLQFTYVYDDGPTKTITERSTLSLDLANKRATLTSDRDHSADTYSIEGLEKLRPSGFGDLVLTGTGTENDKPVDVRISLTLNRNLYTFRKETRPPGKDFLFRDGYSFTRRNPPQ